MINTVAQGVLGRNRSLSVGGWVVQIRKDLGVAEKVETQLKRNSARVVITLSHLASSTNCLQCFCIWMMVDLVLLGSNL